MGESRFAGLARAAKPLKTLKTAMGSYLFAATIRLGLAPHPLCLAPHPHGGRRHVLLGLRATSRFAVDGDQANGCGDKSVEVVLYYQPLIV